MLIIYTRVSELPIIIAAQKEGKLSAPAFFISSAKEAVEALPEKGRVIRSGKSSPGTPNFSAAGRTSSQRNSRAPEALSIFIPTTTAQREGSRETAQESPSLAPDIKESKSARLPKRRIRATIDKTAGIDREEMKLTAFIFVFGFLSFRSYP